MADWDFGYITDLAYVHDFCRVQTPPMLALAALCGGIEARGGAGEPMSYCDLGCGQGYTANLIAAANPSAQVLGIDFNPSHIVNARTLASDAGLSNVEFREASFHDLAADPTVPDFDVVAMHGVFSWISAANRHAIVTMLARRLKPGGLLYISYDCMPGWAGVAPLRSIIARRFAPQPGLSSSAALERAIAYSDALRGADARFHRMFPNVEAQMERLKKTPRAYLAHELLTRDWEAFSFGQVAEELAEAKLAYLGSAYLIDGVDRVNFTEAQQEFLATLDDEVLQQETRDMVLARQFRRDVFVKGRAPARPSRLRERWLDTRFAMTSTDKDFDLNFETPLGKLQLRPDIHGRLVEALRTGPMTLREALGRVAKPATNWQSVTDAIKVLVGRGDLQPALPAAGDAARAAPVQAFNRAVLARATDTAEFGFLASPVTGGAVRVDRLAQLYLLTRQGGAEEPAEVLAKLMLQSTASGGDAASSPEARRELVQTEVARIERDVVPMLDKLGIS